MLAINSLEDADAISACDDVELLMGALRQCAQDILANITMMVAIVRRLEELGITIEVDHPMLPYVTMVARGKLLAECFAECAGDSEMLELAQAASPELQKKIGDRAAFPIVQPNGAIKHLPAPEMTTEQRRAVFHRGVERDEDYQRRQLEAKEARRREANKPRAVEARPRAEEASDVTAYSPPPADSIAAVNLNIEKSNLSFSASKIIHAALRLERALLEGDKPDVREWRDKLIEAVRDYRELGGS